MRRWAVAATLVVALSAPGLAGAGDYDPKRAGHPLKLAYYALYPVGVALDYLIFRPAWHLGQIEPFQTLFGVPEPVPEALPSEEESEAR